jgi:hypothetical protein
MDKEDIIKSILYHFKLTERSQLEAKLKNTLLLNISIYINSQIAGKYFLFYSALCLLTMLNKTKASGTNILSLYGIKQITNESKYSNAIKCNIVSNYATKR